MILHSVLTKLLVQLEKDGLMRAETRDIIISTTRAGVHPEGKSDDAWTDQLREAVTRKSTDAGVKWAKPTSGFRFGSASLKEMESVKPELIEVANLALALSTQDFIFYDGARTYKEQVALKAAGRSMTLNSKHIIQSDGYGHAMDLVPYINGGPKWDWDGCYKVAWAVDQAATQLGFAGNIVWGGAWDRRLSDFGGEAHLYRKEVDDYAQRHPGKDFIDGPHFEWRA